MHNPKAGRKRAKFRRYIGVFVIAVPGLLYLLINNYLPMFGIVIAFKKLDFSKGIWLSPWAGFENFRYLFATRDAWTITRNTVLYNLAFIAIGTVVGIAVAILLNEVRNKIAARFFQSALLIPFLMSMVVVGYLAYAFLASDTGFINNSILKPLGIDPVSWYIEGKYWPVILVVVNQWKSIGFTMVIYLASIVGINPDYYEAAQLDGANKWRQITHITLPMLVPTIITLTLLNLGRMFYSDFGLFYQVPRNSGMLYEYTRTIDVYVYNALMQNSNFSMASAASVYQSIVGFALVMIVNSIVRRVRKEDALF